VTSHSTYKIIIILLIISSTACGYHFSKGGQLPDDITRLSIGVFENRTSETGLENTVTNDLINQFIRFNKFELTSRLESEGHLTGIIESSKITAISYKSAHQATERRITIVLSLKLESPDGKRLQSIKAISENETYEVASNKIATEQNKKSALTELSERIAERIYYHLTDEF